MTTASQDRARRFAVIGDPVAHTKSPRMHGAAFRALNLPHSYEALRVLPGDLERVVQQLRARTYDGLNVTVPHKENVLAFVDELDPSARAVGAANTLVCNPNGSVVAHNTDVPALVAELRELAPERTVEAWGEKQALVLGSGGAARAAVVALAVMGVRLITVRARSVDRATKLSELVMRAGAPALLRAQPLAATEHDGGFGVVVQTTTCGMEGGPPGEAISGAVDWDRLASEAVALDVVYSPPETPFLRAAFGRGLRVKNGLGMLTGQGALAFELWLGVRAPRDVMRAALAS
ncbi:shikimate dehydrogenase [Pendulispora albinea]|uniref:Shikimate dehydrogenase (NADP(+)) n=1 Tax=Pendulispora albinea TaxID=2741071 RepID=A0ABZ2LVX3_9BACT